MSSTSHEIPELDRKGLRSFGLTTGAILCVLFGLVFPFVLSRPIPVWPWALGGTMMLWGLAAPSSLRPVYRGWMRFGLIMSRITTPLILGIVFYVVVTPIALVRSLRGSDAMARAFDKSATTYRVQTNREHSLERPY